jgi:hypothetical protein
MNTRILFTFFVFFSFSLDADENQSAKTDILFLKIQELELEIAELRNKIESQNYLIEKLINESVEPNPSKDLEDIAIGTDIRFCYVLSASFLLRCLLSNVLIFIIICRS